MIIFHLAHLRVSIESGNVDVYSIEDVLDDVSYIYVSSEL